MIDFAALLTGFTFPVQQIVPQNAVEERQQMRALNGTGRNPLPAEQVEQAQSDLSESVEAQREILRELANSGTFLDFVDDNLFLALEPTLKKIYEKNPDALRLLDKLSVTRYALDRMVLHEQNQNNLDPAITRFTVLRKEVENRLRSLEKEQEQQTINENVLNSLLNEAEKRNKVLRDVIRPAGALIEKLEKENLTDDELRQIQSVTGLTRNELNLALPPEEKRKKIEHIKSRYAEVLKANEDAYNAFYEDKEGSRQIPHFRRVCEQDRDQVEKVKGELKAAEKAQKDAIASATPKEKEMLARVAAAELNTLGLRHMRDEIDRQYNRVLGPALSDPQVLEIIYNTGTTTEIGVCNVSTPLGNTWIACLGQGMSGKKPDARFDTAVIGANLPVNIKLQTEKDGRIVMQAFDPQKPGTPLRLTTQMLTYREDGFKKDKDNPPSDGNGFPLIAPNSRGLENSSIKIHGSVHEIDTRGMARSSDIAAPVNIDVTAASGTVRLVMESMDDVRIEGATQEKTPKFTVSARQEDSPNRTAIFSVEANSKLTDVQLMFLLENAQALELRGPDGRTARIDISSNAGPTYPRLTTVDALRTALSEARDSLSAPAPKPAPPMLPIQRSR